MPTGVQLVWLKRDLRAHDHAPLARAAAAGPVLPLYVYEPSLLATPEWDPAHSRFVDESLADLDATLRGLGGRLATRVGEVPGVFAALLEELRPAGGIAALWSHEETGLRVTYDRDRRVARWCREQAVRWVELPQHGVIRPLRSRDGWSRLWQQRMREEPLPPPARIDCVSAVLPGFDFGRRRTPAELGLAASERPAAMPGGERCGREVLRTFLRERGRTYRSDMASPLAGWEGCSRLSPHLAWGTVSMRTVHHAQRERAAELRDAPPSPERTDWANSMRSFAGRLRWHCHFIQKLEDEPEIEQRNMHRAYDGVRTEDPAAWTEAEWRRFAAWRDGRTGYPFVDACVRCLAETGWMNFRMRSMLMSFASYHLWLHWKPTAIVLARRFLDFEPGIHYAQAQMQSGTTGINTVRIYNPIKQGRDQDPAGEFIRRWVPELDDVPAEHLHEPWKLLHPRTQGLFNADPASHPYPPPIVEHASAYREAQRRIFEVRATAAARAESRRVYLKHGSRKRPGDPPYRGGPEDRNLR